MDAYEEERARTEKQNKTDERAMKFYKFIAVLFSSLKLAVNTFMSMALMVGSFVFLAWLWSPRTAWVVFAVLWAFYAGLNLWGSR